MLRSARRVIRRNFALKVFSILVAIVLWVYVTDTQDPIREDSFEQDIQTTGTPEGLDVVRVRPERAKVLLRARTSELERARLPGPHIFADLTNAGPGRNIVPLEVEGVPQPATLEGVDPPTAQVWLDQSVRAEKPVNATIIGRPAEGHEVLGGPVVTPAEVQVSGPAGAVEDVAELVVSVDVTGWTTRRSLRVEIEPLDLRLVPVAGIVLHPASVEVDVPVFRVKTARVPVRPRTGTPADGFELRSRKVKPDAVTLRGTPEDLGKVSEVVTEWLDIRDLRDTRSYQVKLVEPRSTWLVENARTVTVTVTVRPKPEAKAEGASEPEGEGAAPERSGAGLSRSVGGETPSSDVESGDGGSTGESDRDEGAPEGAGATGGASSP